MFFFLSCSKAEQKKRDVPLLEVEQEVISISKEVEKKVNPNLLKLQNLLQIFPTYGAAGSGENAGLYLAEKNEIVHTIFENQETFLNDLERLLLNDTKNLLRLVDKKHFLEKEDNPKDIIPLKPNNAYLLNRNDLSLRDFVEDALRKMSFAAKEEGVTIVASSTYRSYEYQDGLYERNVKELGQEAADRESARPGTSQHQLGTVVDFGSITDEFALTKAGIWLDNNASRFGFSLSFPQGYEEVTGYRWESWHYRYIGLEACLFQEAYFNNIQQYMLEFIHLWKNLD
ncbi:MAG TPA: peptidase M15 [Treponema sp.]|nr:peptidase M15 [Treponema sp.]